jgi:hypothetical protein
VFLSYYYLTHTFIILLLSAGASSGVLNRIGFANKLVYENESYSISSLALKLLNEKCNWKVKAIAGGPFFKYEGISLSDIQKQMELENFENGED